MNNNGNNNKQGRIDLGSSGVICYNIIGGNYAISLKIKKPGRPLSGRIFILPMPPSTSLQVSLVHSVQELSLISALNAENLKSGISEEEQATQGFVSWRYELPLLEALHRYAPSVVCTDGDQLAGYALTAPPESAAVHSELEALIKKIHDLPYEGCLLKQYRFYILGQLCVAKSYRGMGVVEQMYAYHREQFASTYELMVLTIATKNTRSLRVHERIGFRNIHFFDDHFGGWNVYVWDWR